MFDLIHVSGNTYYIENPARVGVYLASDGAWLIDGGFGPDAGERILELTDSRGWKIAGIIATHSHPDHIGGCRTIQEKTGCGVFAHGMEAALLQFPLLHPSFTYGGFPYRTLRGRGMMAESADVREMEGNIPSELELLPLPGHSFDMAGIRTPDGTVFLADALCSENVLERYGITFLYDAGAYISTLEKISGMEADMFIPSHVSPSADVKSLARLNIKAVLSVADRIVSWCCTPQTTEAILQNVFREYRRNTVNFEQYGLVGSTVRSYLAWLKDTGRLASEFRGNIMFWRSTL